VDETEREDPPTTHLGCGFDGVFLGDASPDIDNLTSCKMDMREESIILRDNKTHSFLIVGRESETSYGR
jgi:hypothetical protein